MSQPPLIQPPPYRFESRVSDPQIILVQALHEPFIKLMDALYPQLIQNSEERRGIGYSAFRADTGEFIGSFTGKTLASVRKNPWLKDDGKWFLRALLGAMEIEGHKAHYSRTKARNYGTLRLWLKLGLGAKRYGTAESYVSAYRDEAGKNTLAEAIFQAQPGYTAIREVAVQRMARVDPARFLPTAGMMLGDRSVAAYPFSLDFAVDKDLAIG